MGSFIQEVDIMKEGTAPPRKRRKAPFTTTMSIDRLDWLEEERRNTGKSMSVIIEGALDKVYPMDTEQSQTT